MTQILGKLCLFQPMLRSKLFLLMNFNALFADEQALAVLINTHTASGTFYSRGLVSGPLPVLSGVNIEIDVSHGKFNN